MVVASTGSATEKSYEQNAVVELVETPAVKKRPMVVTSTNSVTPKSPMGKTRSLSLSKRPLWGKLLRWWLRQAQPPKNPKGKTRSLSLSKRPLWGKS